MSKYDWAAIKAKINIADVIGASVVLKKKGNIHEGCCPFHHEKTPSFKVFQDNFHCFGCNEHGDVVDFVMKMDNIDANQAIEKLNAGDFELPGQEKKILESRKKQQEDDRAQAILSARQKWESAPAAPADHPYLIKKKIKPHMARMDGKALLLPVYDKHGDVQSLQTIAADGSKLFLSGAPMKGGRLHFGICIGRTIIVEGFATGASIHEALPDRVTVAWSKHGIIEIARELKEAGMDVAIAADRNAMDEMLKLGQELGIPVFAPPAPHDDFNDLAVDDDPSLIKPILNGAPLVAAVQDDEEEEIDDDGPVNIWARNDPPELRKDIVPDLIYRASCQASALSGADKGGYAMAMLGVLSAALTDRVKVKVKRSEEWYESSRLWICLIGLPSYMKSPIMNLSAKQLAKIDGELVREYEENMRDWEESKMGDPPIASRTRIDDITMEAAQEVARYSPDGVLALQDELSGWFGGIEKYSGGKGSAKDRSFWLRSYNGGEYSVSRISRKPFIIDNLSFGILGGVQPDAMRKIMADSTDDGLIQRFMPIILRPATIGQDDLPNDAIREYDDLVRRMHQIKPPSNFMGDKPLVFDDEAQKLRYELEVKHHAMVNGMERVNLKMASHLGKYNGMFARLCVLFHAIENANAEELPEVITGATAKRAAKLLHEYVMKHSAAFYFDMIGLSEDQEYIADIAGYILARGLTKMTSTTFHHGSPKMRKITRSFIETICHQLEALGWVTELDIRGSRFTATINPLVHELFKEQAAIERVRRKEDMKGIKEAVQG